MEQRKDPKRASEGPVRQDLGRPEAGEERFDGPLGREYLVLCSALEMRPEKW